MSAEDYFARVDAHLLELDEDGRRRFLDTQIAQFEERYGDFQSRVHRGAPTRGSMDAFDYQNTICGLERRLSTATAEAMADVRRWQDAYRKSAGYRSEAM